MSQNPSFKTKLHPYSIISHNLTRAATMYEHSTSLFFFLKLKQQLAQKRYTTHIDGGTALYYQKNTKRQ